MIEPKKDTEKVFKIGKMRVWEAINKYTEQPTDENMICFLNIVVASGDFKEYIYAVCENPSAKLQMKRILDSKHKDLNFFGAPATATCLETLAHQ